MNETQPITIKMTATAIIAAALATGGTYTLDQQQIGTLNETITAQSEQINHELRGKHDILKRYIYSQIASCKSPTLDLTYTNTDEIAQQTYNLVKENGIDPNTVDLTLAIKQVAAKNCDATCK